ncbi:PHD finger protein 3 [Galdieria sulphuraria]|nr:PHD finger protein 3 [Galdieria sulphuraria]
MVKVRGSENKRPKRKRENILLQENLPKDWFWVWWPDSGWWKVRITDVEEEEEWYWPRTQEPLDTPILSLTISYASHKNGSTCFIERVLWHEGVLYDQEGEETISYCLNPPQDNVANSSEQLANEDSLRPSSPSTSSNETGSRRSQEKVFNERNKETKEQANIKTTKVGTSPRKDSFMQERVAENIREKAKNVLNQILLENLEDTGVDIDKTNISKIAIDIENALFEKYFKADYLEQLRSLTFNLRGKRNLDLKRAIVMSDISPTRLAEMTADELASKSMREERKRREQESFARAVIRDPTDVGIMKGMNSTEVLPQRSEDAYENGQIFPTDNSLQEACREDVEAGIEDSGVQGSLPVNKEIIHEMDSIQSCLHVNETTQQKNNVEAQKSSSLTLSSLEFSMSNSLDDKFQQFASSMGEPESNKRNRSILRGSTTDAILLWRFIWTELTSTIEFVKGLEYSTSREFSVVYFKPKDSRDEGGFKELIDFLSRRKRAGVLFQTGQSEAYILPPGKITCRVHEYGMERVLGVIVTRKTPLEEPPMPLSEQVKVGQSEHLPQGSHLRSMDEENNSLSPHIQLSAEPFKEVIVSEPEKEKQGSFAMFTKNISTNLSSAPEKGVLNSNITTEEQHKILPGLSKGPQLSSVMGIRSLSVVKQTKGYLGDKAFSISTLGQLVGS